MGAEEDLQLALYAVLNGDATLTALATGGVHEAPDKDTSYPYVVIDDLIVTNADDKDSNGFEILAHIHTLSRKAGRLEMRKIQARVYDLLQDQGVALTAQLTDHACTYCYLDGSEGYVEEDGKTRHGVQRFRLYLEEN